MESTAQLRSFIHVGLGILKDIVIHLTIIVAHIRTWPEGTTPIRIPRIARNVDLVRREWHSDIRKGGTGPGAGVDFPEKISLAAFLEGVRQVTIH